MHIGIIHHFYTNRINVKDFRPGIVCLVVLDRVGVVIRNNDVE
jgi:hypothetical protein